MYVNIHNNKYKYDLVYKRSLYTKGYMINKQLSKY